MSLVSRSAECHMIVFGGVILRVFAPLHRIEVGHAFGATRSRTDSSCGLYRGYVALGYPSLDAVPRTLSAASVLYSALATVLSVVLTVLLCKALYSLVPQWFPSWDFFPVS